MNTVEFWKAAGIRAVKTFFQVILGMWTAGQLVTEINWKLTLISAGSAALYSLITSIVAGLPEVKLEATLYALDNNPAPEEEDK